MLSFGLKGQRQQRALLRPKLIEGIRVEYLTVSDDVANRIRILNVKQRVLVQHQQIR